MAQNFEDSLWRGPVWRQLRSGSTWQSLGLVVFKDELKCFRNEVGSNPVLNRIKSFYTLRNTQSWKGTVTVESLGWP